MLKLHGKLALLASFTTVYERGGGGGGTGGGQGVDGGKEGVGVMLEGRGCGAVWSGSRNRIHA